MLLLPIAIAIDVSEKVGVNVWHELGGEIEGQVCDGRFGTGAGDFTEEGSGCDTGILYLFLKHFIALSKSER